MEEQITSLRAKYETLKVDLVYTDGKFFNEGVWVTFDSKEDELKAVDDNNIGEKITCYLLNEPVGGWANKRWGSKIIATTMGEHRPIAKESDQ